MTDPTFKLASYNIHKAVGTDRKRDPSRILKVLGEVDADVVILQEADRRFGQRERTLPDFLVEQHTDYMPVPFDVQHDSMGWHGNTIMVRRDITVLEHDVLHIPYLEPRGVVTATLRLPTGPELTVFGMHLDLSGLWRVRQARAIAELARVAQEQPRCWRVTSMNGDPTAAASRNSDATSPCSIAGAASTASARWGGSTGSFTEHRWRPSSSACTTARSPRARPTTFPSGACSAYRIDAPTLWQTWLERNGAGRHTPNGEAALRLSRQQ